MLFYSYGEQEYSKTPVLEYLFNKVAARRSPRYFPVNIQNFGKVEKLKRANLENSVNVQRQPPEMLS